MGKEAWRRPHKNRAPWDCGWGSEAGHLPVLHRVLGLVLSPQGGLAWKAEAEIGITLSSAKNPQKLEEAGRLFFPTTDLKEPEAADTLTLGY